MPVNLTYSKPNSNSLKDEIKPSAYSGKNYPLRDLSHRQFEILMYSIYNEEIHSHKINFKDVQLMSGIRDKAQDCVLFKDDRKEGLIQCKHSEKDTPLTTRICVEEIIKFILYSIKEPGLLPDIHSFKYFFASSSGFKMDTDEYLRTFNKKIKKEKNLEKWSKNVLKNYSSLELEYEDINNELKDRLENLQVEIIIPTDIQSKLVEYESIIVPNFFEIKMVIDREEWKKTMDSFVVTSKPKTITPEKIILEFQQASIFLANYKSYFSLNIPIKLERKATSEITEWLQRPLKTNENNIGILKGGAGSGKSVVLNNLYNQLINDNIPVIAFKADEKNAITINELEQKLNLSTSLDESVSILSANFQKVVVIIDQIDALSQTLSANRDLLGTYLMLVEKLKNKSNVRVIISVREYDLSYDPYLIPLQKNTSFDAGSLDRKDVIDVLQILQVSGYTEKLITLLQVPLHLELFCQVYSKKKKFIKFYSLYDLYNELWNIKIAKKKPKDFKESIVKTLYSISLKIYESQTLSVSTIPFELEDIDLLKTEGLVFINNAEQLMFFHQTFYDYIFARQFVESNKSVIDYLNENNQGLFIRSSLKIILAHLREQNSSSYNNLITNLLVREDIRFHIKQLIVNYLGFIQDPNEIEQTIAEQYLIGSQYELLFFESINTLNWINHIIKKDWLKKYLNKSFEDLNVVFQLFLRNLNLAGYELLDFLITLDINELNSNLISRLLFFLVTWNDTAIKLFVKIKPKIINDSHMFCHCIEHAVNFSEDWAFDEFEKFLLIRVENLNGAFDQFKVDHYEIELFNKLYIKSYQKAFILNQKIIEAVVYKTQGVRVKGSLIEDGAFWLYNKNSTIYGKYDLMNLYIQHVEKIAERNDQYFENLILRYGNSKYVSFLRVLIYGFIKMPNLYCNQALKIILHINKSNGFVYNEKLQFLVRKLLQLIYSFLSTRNKQKLNSKILSIVDKHENQVIIHHLTQKKTYTKYRGYLKYKFLQAIPYNEILNFPDVKNEFLMLNRRFGKVKDTEPNNIVVKGVPPPYKKENYLKMTLENWEKTFIKYNDEYKPDIFSDEGSKLEHCRSFEEQITERPDFFYPLIKKIISNDKISSDYKTYAINGLVKAQYNVSLVHDLIIKQIENKLDRGNILFTIWSIDYLITNNKMDKILFDFLCDEALYNPHPDKDSLSNPLQLSINSVRGAALERLIKTNDKTYERKLFTVINKAIVIEKKYAIKATIVFNSAYLIRLSPTKAFIVFKKIINKDKRVIKESFWSAKYFANTFFSKMDFFINLALKNKNTYGELSNLLCLTWLRGLNKSENYLFPLLKKSKDARREAVRVAIHPQNLINNYTLNDKCFSLFKYSLSSSDNEIIDEYSNAFLHFKPEMFNVLFPVLKSYASSVVFTKSPAYFCKYITKSCNKSTVDKCIELVSKFDKFDKTDISKRSYYDSEPINTILAIYNTLGNTSIDFNHKETCMDMFDKMLQQPQHREAANKASTLAEI